VYKREREREREKKQRENNFFLKKMNSRQIIKIKNKKMPC
jgi:hypothetical protein